MSNSAPKHLENSQRCCFFAFVYVGTHQHSERPGCWGRPAIWTSSLLPLTSRVPAAQARSGWTRERSEGIVCFASLQTHSNTSGKTHSAAHGTVVKTISGCAFWLFQQQKEHKQIESKWKTQRRMIQDGGGGITMHLHLCSPDTESDWLMETGLAKS